MEERDHLCKSPDANTRRKPEKILIISINAVGTVITVKRMSVDVTAGEVKLGESGGR